MGIVIHTAPLSKVVIGGIGRGTLHAQRPGAQLGETRGPGGGGWGGQPEGGGEEKRWGRQKRGSSCGSCRGYSSRRSRSGSCSSGSRDSINDIPMINLQKFAQSSVANPFQARITTVIHRSTQYVACCCCCCCCCCRHRNIT